jgi:cytochrome c oxidase subunit IV
MTEARRHQHPNYMAIFWWLLALTILEIAVIYTPLAKLVITLLLIGLALGKASLVALYFMHLRFERVPLGVIAVTPLVLCVFLVFMLTPDLGAVLRHSPKAEPVAESVHH